MDTRMKKIWKFLFPLVLIGIVILIFNKTHLIKDGSESYSQNTELSLRLKWLWYAGWAGELVAQEHNFWANEGLNVKIEPGGFELDPIKLVATGTNDIGIAGADQILLAREKGIKLIAFATQYQESPVGFVSLKKSGITKIEDFKGKKIGVKFGTDVEPVYRTLLAKVGLNSNEFEEFPVRFDITPLFSGIIDVYPGYLTNDLLFPEERGYEVNTIIASDYGVSYYGNVYFCTEEFLTENQDLVIRFYKAIYKGWTKALMMPAEEVATLALEMSDGLNIEHETHVVKSLHQYIIPEGAEFGSMTDEGWKQLYDMLQEQKVLKLSFDYKQAYTFDIINNLN
jgi:ABC-type nitrate/sulfonate/bicarbonate transport system substrate-binding protein